MIQGKGVLLFGICVILLLYAIPGKKDRRLLQAIKTGQMVCTNAPSDE